MRAGGNNKITTCKSEGKSHETSIAIHRKRCDELKSARIEEELVERGEVEDKMRAEFFVSGDKDSLIVRWRNKKEWKIGVEEEREKSVEVKWKKGEHRLCLEPSLIFNGYDILYKNLSIQWRFHYQRETKPSLSLLRRLLL